MSHSAIDVANGRVRRWWAAQVSDAEMARRLGCGPRKVCAIRKRLGLSSWYAGGKLNAAQRANRRLAMARTAAAKGVPSLVKLVPPGWAEKRRAELAGRYGLPADLHIVQVRVVVLLARGPASASRIARALGLRADRSGYHSFNSPQVAGGNHLTDLLHRGLVDKIPANRGGGKGSGRGESVYFLTPAALGLLSKGVA